jgi:hypothetical protein
MTSMNLMAMREMLTGWETYTVDRASTAMASISGPGSLIWSIPQFATLSKIPRKGRGLKGL